MIALKTQSPAYWQKEFVVGDEDMEYLHEFIMEAEAPVSTKALVLALIKNRCQREAETLRKELDKGPLYQPKDSYTVGQTIVLPAFNFAVGKVIGSRPGYNPAQGSFEVIQVQFEDSGEVREFASKLNAPHALNRSNGDDGLSFLSNQVSAEELAQEHGEVVEARLLEKLNAPEQTFFVQYQGTWLTRDMLADIHVGHLNIAEAAIDVAGLPLTVDQLLRDLDLPAEINPAIQRFSLNAALSADERFENVGWDGDTAWFLRRMIPEDVLTPPSRLEWLLEPYDRSAIEPELLTIEKDIDDEAISATSDVQVEATVYSTRIVLTYPHWRSGTLPLSTQIRAMLPQKGASRYTRIEIIDGQSGETMVGWVNHQGGYIAGLSEWYRQHQLVAGAYIRVERTKKPGVVIVSFEPRRMRREWVRVASVEQGVISFGMQKRPIACEYDELMAVDHTDAKRIDDFVEWLREERRPLSEIVRSVFPELVKLSPSGTAHAKTIYSAVNVFRRCPPGPIFAMLSSAPWCVYEGTGLWSFDESRA